MFFTLQRYIFRELLRVFMLTAVGLTLMLSLGMILRPVQQYGLGLGQVLTLLGFFIPISMTMVLPIAALFSCTLTYGRFSADNELNACRASGISMSMLIYPGLVLSIIIAIVTLLFSFWIVPNYVRRAENAIKADAHHILFRNLERRGFYQLPRGNYKLYAEDAYPAENKLVGAVVAYSDHLGRFSSIITADAATVDFEDHGVGDEEGLTVTISAWNAGRLDDTGVTHNQHIKISVPFPPLLGDNIKFKTVDSIKSIKADPSRFKPVADQTRRLLSRAAVEVLHADISTAFASAQPAQQWYQMTGKDRVIRFTAESVALRQDTIELTGVNLEERDASAAGRPVLFTWKTTRATIQLKESGSFTMVMYNANWRGPDNIERIAVRPAFHELHAPASAQLPSTGRLLQDVAAATALLSSPSEALLADIGHLDRSIRRVMASIQAETHVRLSFGLGCILLILIGIALGIMLKGGHLLTAFGASSIPAAILIVCIMMGKNLVKNPSANIPGVIVIWSGLLFLAIIGFFLYRRLLRT